MESQPSGSTRTDTAVVDAQAPLWRRRSAVIFDLDGTLTRPTLDFDAIRAEIGLGPGPILESLADLDLTDRRRAWAILERHEHRAAAEAQLHDGAVQVIEACRRSGHPVAILTRNSRASVELILRSHSIVVDALRTREDGSIKPDPEPVTALCRTLNADSHNSWMIGDYLFDLMSGRGAGARTVLMIGDRPTPDYASQADFVIEKLTELYGILGVNA